MTEVFEADYHETEEALPIVYNLGRLCLEWNMLEQFFTALIWHLLGDYEVGMAVTGGLGNQSRADIVLNLARQQPNSEELVKQVEHACKAFNILRENRNILVHSHSIYPADGGAVHWRRATGRGPVGHLTTVASFTDLEEQIAAIATLGFFTTDLVGMINAQRSGTAYERHSAPFSLPKRLAPVREETSSV